jgi:hypothetical protein
MHPATPVVSASPPLSVPWPLATKPSLVGGADRAVWSWGIWENSIAASVVSGDREFEAFPVVRVQ